MTKTKLRQYARGKPCMVRIPDTSQMVQDGRAIEQIERVLK